VAAFGLCLLLSSLLFLGCVCCMRSADASLRCLRTVDTQLTWARGEKVLVNCAAFVFGCFVIGC
jgi:hypothetical protein